MVLARAGDVRRRPVALRDGPGVPGPRRHVDAGRRGRGGLPASRRRPRAVRGARCAAIPGTRGGAGRRVGAAAARAALSRRIFGDLRQLEPGQTRSLAGTPAWHSDCAGVGAVPTPTPEERTMRTPRHPKILILSLLVLLAV